MARRKERERERGQFEIQCRHGTTYTHCNSMTAYPGRSDDVSAEDVNRCLNLHLGLPVNPRNIVVLRKVCKILSDILSFFESYVYQLWDATPDRFRQVLALKSWKVYCSIHKRLLSNKTAIHKDASLEYHAFTTFAYWGAIFPITLKRVRFALNQLVIQHGHDVYPYHCPRKMRDCAIQRVQYDAFPNSGQGLQLSTKRPSDRPVHGYFIPHQSSDKVLFYLYGGAYLGGEAKGNILYATKLSQRCNMNVFLPDYCLIPEHHFVDAYEDVLRSYEYLITVRKIPSQNIILFGISSGGGLCMRLLQRIVEQNLQPSYMPSGAVLLSPFVEYTEPRGSMRHYSKHDLIVNQSVYDMGIPYIDTQGDDEFRYNASPVNRSMEGGLPPLCLIISEHECCYDQNVRLCNRAREAGVHVDLAVWKFMCHVFGVLPAFLPEARGAIDFFCDWIDNRWRMAMVDDDDDEEEGGEDDDEEGTSVDMSIEEIEEL